jgi:hypothetical protein
MNDASALTGVLPRMCVDALDALFGRAAVYWEPFRISEACSCYYQGLPRVK